MGNVVTKGQDNRSGFWLNISSRITELLGANLFGTPKWGALSITLPNGRTRTIGDRTSKNHAHLKLNNLKLFSQIKKRGTVGFASSYMRGDIESNDLVNVFRFFLKNKELFDKAGKGLIKRAAHDLAFHLSRKNTKQGARKNIAEHYDLGNDFYSLWLDPSMTYSSAFFENESQTLEQAQIAKFQKVATMAGIKQGASVFEIGCGWGGFAKFLAQQYKAKTYGVSLSNQQLKYARDIIENEGLEDLASFHFEDYRDGEGEYDNVCSIEMIEAVGEEHWGEYFSSVHDRLKIGGKAAIQAITISEDNFAHYKNHPDFIQRYIFPGGMLLTKQAMYEQGKIAGLELEQSEFFAKSYARTLAIWRENFIAQWEKIKALGFDEEFKRKWIYYLSYCEAGFDEGIIDVGIYQYKKSEK